MNTLLSWTPLLFSFLLGTASTSLSGFVCCAAARWLGHKHPDLFAFLAWVFAVASLYGMCVTGSLLLLLPLLALCTFGGLAERATYVPRRSLVEVVPQMWLATACNGVFSASWLIIVSLSISRTSNNEQWFDAGAMLGAFCSPAAISFFIYLWKNSRLRPGLDIPKRPTSQSGQEERF